MPTIEELKTSQAIKVKPFLDILLTRTNENAWSGDRAAFALLEKDTLTFYNNIPIYEDGLDETLKEVEAIEKVIPLEDVIIINLKTLYHE